MNDRDFDDIFKEGLNNQPPFQFTEAKWDKIAYKLNAQPTPRPKRPWLTYAVVAVFVTALFISDRLLTGYENNSRAKPEQANVNSLKPPPEAIRGFPAIKPPVDVAARIAPRQRQLPERKETLIDVRTQETQPNNPERPASTGRIGFNKKNAAPIVEASEKTSQAENAAKSKNTLVESSSIAEQNLAKNAVEKFNPAMNAASANVPDNPAPPTGGNNSISVSPISNPAPRHSDQVQDNVNLPAQSKKWAQFSSLSLPKPEKLSVDPFNYTFDAGQPVRIRRPALNKIAWEIGATAGWVFINSYDVRQPNGYAVGFRAGLLLNERVQLFGEAQYLGLIYGFKRDSLSAEARAVKPPAPDYALKYVTAQKPTIQFSVGVQYFLIPTGAFRPYLGLALLAHSELEGKYKYTFKKIQTEEETDKEELKKNPKIDIEALRLPAGFDVYITKNIKIKAEAAYDFALRPASSYRPAWNVKTGLFLQFPHNR